MGSAVTAQDYFWYMPDALQQRVSGESIYTSDGTLFVRNKDGTLISENPLFWNTSAITEYIYLNGTPVAVATGPTTLYYIYPDHLDTPRVVVNAANNIVWRWDSTDPFGSLPADSNPSGLGAFTFNLRFPGQYFNQETGLHYNYYRDYDPSTGRYIESDPIGLDGGINTYTYVNNDPPTGTDQLGLAKFCCRLLDSTFFGTVLRKRHCYIVADDGITYGLYPENDIGVPGTNYPKDRGGECFDCPPLNCNQNKCLKDAHDSYPRGDWSARGPNSNTYAGTLARSCCKGGVPGGVHGAPGIDDQPPTPRPPIPRDQRR